MKIVHALGWYFPESLGGTEVYVAALARHQRKSGDDVLVVAPDASREDERQYEHEGVSVYRYPIPAAPTRDEVQGRAATRGTERFHRWLERTRPDIFHSHSLVTGLGLRELQKAKTLGAKLVVTCHTPSLGFLCQRGTMMRWGKEWCDGLVEPRKCAPCALRERGLSDGTADFIGRLPMPVSRVGSSLPGRLGTGVGMAALIEYNQRAQRKLTTLVDALVVLTDWARNAVAANDCPEEKLVLNRLGIVLNGSEGKPREVDSKNPVRFGFLGRFHPTKGVVELAEAVTQLPPEVPFSLEIRGPVRTEDDRRILKALQRALAGDARARFEPGVAHDEVGTVLAGFDVLLCPSTCMEGGPTVAMEAQAVGTPVVGSRIGGLAEIIEDGVNGRLVPPGDASALASAMKEVILDPDHTVGRWRKNLRTPRTMDDVAEDYARLYQRCLAP